MKEDNVIEIKNELRIPGTDVILEAGDKIKVLKESRGDLFNIRGELIKETDRLNLIEISIPNVDSIYLIVDKSGEVYAGEIGSLEYAMNAFNSFA